MTNFSHYNENSSYYNGQKINDKRNLIKYDGNKLLLLKNNNGDIEYQTLSNKDINDMIIHKQDNENLEDRLGKILILRKMHSKKNVSKKNVTKKTVTKKNKKRCKKGSRRNRITGRCRKIKNIKSKKIIKTKNLVDKQIRDYTPDKLKTIW